MCQPKGPVFQRFRQIGADRQARDYQIWEGFWGLLQTAMEAAMLPAI
jgi:hypothetical protein